MAKRTRNHRRKALPVDRSGNLIVVAGIPDGLSQQISKWLKGEFSSNDTFIVQASSKNDFNCYSSNYLKLLVNATSDIAIRRRSHNRRMPTPSAFYIFYVPTADQKNLLTRFDFSAFPVALPRLADRSDTGLMFRHVEAEVKQALDALLRGNMIGKREFRTLKDRILRQSSDEELLLPPENFLLSTNAELKEKRKIGDEFIKYRNGEYSWAHRLNGLDMERVNSEVMAHLEYGRNLNLYKDSRGLYFRISEPHEHHGASREIEDDAEQIERLLALKSLYRFGAPVESGLHHDLQFQRGVTLDNIELQCARSGTVTRSGTHAAVFTDDVVR